MDSSTAPFAFPTRPDVHVISVTPGTSVPEKRNRALAAASGRFIAWFDDDDWQHSDRLVRLIPILEAGACCAGPRKGWLVELFQRKAWHFGGLDHGVLFNGAAFVTEFARRFRFAPHRRRASDTAWMASLLRGCPEPPKVVEPNFFWILHGANLSLSARGRSSQAFPLPAQIDQIRASVGETAWADTDQELDALCKRMAAMAHRNTSNEPH